MISLTNDSTSLPNSNLFTEECSLQEASSHTHFGKIISKQFAIHTTFEQLNLLRHPQNSEALMVSQNLNKYLYVSHKARVSYKDLKEKNLVYLIQFNDALDDVHHITVFEMKDLNAHHLISDRVERQEKNQGHPKIYKFLENSSLEITIKIFKKNSKIFINIEDKHHASIFTYSSLGTANHSLGVLKEYLKIICERKTKEKSADYIHAVLKILDNYVSHTDTETLKRIFHKDIELLEMLLVFFFFYIPLDQFGLKAHQFLENVLSLQGDKKLKLVSYACESDVNGFYSFILHTEFNQELILRKWEVEKENLEKIINEALKLVKIQDSGQNCKASIQLSTLTSMNEIHEYLKSIKIENLIDKPPVELLIMSATDHFPYFDYNRFFILEDGRVEKSPTVSSFHPLLESISEISRMKNFDISFAKESSESGRYTFYGSGKNQPKDLRLFHFHTIGSLEELEVNFADKIHESLELIRKSLTDCKIPPKWNRLVFKVLPACTTTLSSIKIHLEETLQLFQTALKELHIEKVYVYFGLIDGETTVKYTFRASHLLFDLPIYSVLPGDKGENIYSLDSERKTRLKKAAQRGHSWAYDISRILDDASKQIRDEWKAPKKGEEFFQPLEMIPGSTKVDPKTGFLDPEYGELAVNPHHQSGRISDNIAHYGVIVGIKTNDLGHGLYIKRLLLIADMTQSSTITCEQCAYINAALRFARKNNLAIDWFPGSYGTTIAMDTGVEHLDGCASTAKEIILTAIDAKIPINVIVDNINVGAQAYWDALAAIIPKTSGIVIMTQRGSMALTGDKALTSVLNSNLTSEEITKKSRQFFPNGTYDMGGYRSIYGPNGNATAFVNSLVEACVLLLKHHAFYDYEKITSIDNDKMTAENSTELAKLVNEIQSGHPIDQKYLLSLFKDSNCFEGIFLWKDKKNIYAPQSDILHIHQNPSTVIKEMTLGGHPVILICPKVGALTNSDSEIIAKAINKASGHLPVVLMGSILGYYSDPGSMFEGQLNSGSSIVEAIVHFQGPLIFVNLGSMIGGICVTFSKKLNKNITVIALEGSKFEVVGGEIAEKIIFKSDTPDHKMAAEFDKLHDAHRAMKVGAADYVVSPITLKETICNILSHSLHTQIA